MSIQSLRASRLLFTAALLGGSFSLAGCDEVVDDTAAGEISFRPGSGVGGMTFNTSNWVSPGARDIYEYRRDGDWYTNSFGFETRLARVIFDDPEFGLISSDPSGSKVAGQARVEISAAGELELTVFPPVSGPPKTYSGGELIGMELKFRVKYNGGSAYTSKVRVLGTDTDPFGGALYEFHKVDPSTDELLAPVCETSTLGDRFARFYGDVRVNAFTGAVDEPEGIVHIACTAGAPGKSSTYGYLPHGAPETFRLANRVIRADYCADGYPYTYPGNSLIMRDNFSEGQEGQTLADVYASLDGDQLEGMWGVEGILCIDTPRVDSLERIDVICPVKSIAGQIEYNWRPPACDTFVDPEPGALRFFSLTASES